MTKFQVSNGRGDEHSFDFSEVLPGLFLGSDFCKGGVCFLHAEEFKKLEVSVELNLSLEENELPPKEIGSYVWLPVADGHAPSPEQLDIGSSVINAGLANGKRVYIHCKNGHGRSPTMVAAYLIRYQNKSVDEAVAYVQGKRNEVHVEVSQREALAKFSEKWRGENG